MLQLNSLEFHLFVPLLAHVIKRHNVNIEEEKASQINGKLIFHRKMAKMRQIFPFKNAEFVIHVFLSSCIDSSTALSSGLPRKGFRGLQMVLNAAARVLIKSCEFCAYYLSAVIPSLAALP